MYSRVRISISRLTVRANSWLFAPSRYKLGRGDRGGKQELYPMIVEHVDEPGEAARDVALSGGHPRHVRHDDHRERARELEVVDLRARPFAQRREVEPDHAAGAPLGHGHRAPSTISRGSSSGPGRIALEERGERSRRPRPAA